MNKWVKEDQLHRIASKFGKVQSCLVKTTPDGKPIGKALVGYATKDEAGVALQKLYMEDDLGTNVEIEFYKHNL